MIMATHISGLTENEMRSVEAEIRDLADQVDQVAELRNEARIEVSAVTLQVMLDALAHVD
jgi:hypothetical protein